MNRVELIGRITRDPEIIKSGKGNTVARFSLAVQRSYKNDDGEYDADFISCVAFGKTAEFIESYLFKGFRVAVAGHIQTGSYENKDGNTIYTTDVIVDSVYPIDWPESKKDDKRSSKSNRR